MADKKISELTSIVGADTAADDFFVVVDTSGSVTKKISRAELNNAIEQDVLAQVDITSANIDGGTIDNTPIGSTTASTGNFTTVDTSGNVTVGGNLTVNGTTTTVNSTTLDVDDINITVASGAASAAAADGAGLTVDGASATFNYASTGDKWTMNKPLDVSGTVTMTGATTTGDINFGDNDKAVFGAGSDLQIYHDGSNSFISDASGTGNLKILTNTLQIKNSADTEIGAKFIEDGAVTLYHNNAEKLATTSSGIDVTGTVTADGLTVSTDGYRQLLLTYPDAFTSKLQVGFTNFYVQGSVTTDELTIANNSSGQTKFINQSKASLLIDNSNDISFYDSTGVTQGFYWDASTQRLGLGLTNPAYVLDTNSFIKAGGLAVGSGANPKTVSIAKDGGGSQMGIDVHNLGTATGDDSVISFETQASREWTVGLDRSAASFNISKGSTLTSDPKLVVSDAGNVGIGTASIDNKLHLENAGTLYLQIENTSTANKFYLGNSGGNAILESTGAYSMNFKTNGSEAARFDSSQNFLVSKTAADISVVGVEARANGSLIATKDNDKPLLLNRLTSDGDAIEIRKDGTTGGSIGINSTRPYFINSASGGIRIGESGGQTVLLPCDTTGAATDNQADVGYSSSRWDDIYATNGTIQTSDRNEKQDIEALSDAEQRVAVAAKGLLRKYRWKSSVEEKGDDARIHFGIIAQDLQAAFEAEGLDAGRYAMFINSEWTDEETGEQKSRMGIRYNQLLAFIIAAI